MIIQQERSIYSTVGTIRTERRKKRGDVNSIKLTIFLSIFHNLLPYIVNVGMVNEIMLHTV